MPIKVKSVTGAMTGIEDVVLAPYGIQRQVREPPGAEEFPIERGSEKKLTIASSPYISTITSQSFETKTPGFLIVNVLA